jgi:hypothetical protein
MTTENVCFYLQNRLIQTSQTGSQWYSDTSPFSIPWFDSNKRASLSYQLVGASRDEKEDLKFKICPTLMTAVTRTCFFPFY